MPDSDSDSFQTLALLELARNVAVQATAFLLDGWRAPRTIDTKSSATDLVTEMDRGAEERIVTVLREARPGDGFLGEEGAFEASETGITWVIDPIDGTTNYVYGLPAWCVSIAALDPAGARVGVVAVPPVGEIYWAVRGGGAFRNGAAIRVSAKDELGTALVATGFSYDVDRRSRQAAVVARLMPHIRDIRRGGSAALDLCSVACGRVDAYFEGGTRPWDRAAGALVVREAGGVVDPDSDDLCVAAPPALHAALRAWLPARL